MVWFQRAGEQRNLRLPGSTPFHLKVTFRAFPGLELLPPGKEQILTGDGVYEETWLSPYEWRRAGLTRCFARDDGFMTMGLRL
jgi:hypothetical protein